MEVQEWRIFDQLEPFSDRRAVLLTGHHMALLANINRDPKKGQPYQPWQMLPGFLEKPKPSPEQLVAQISQIFGRVVTEPDVLVPHERIE